MCLLFGWAPLAAQEPVGGSGDASRVCESGVISAIDINRGTVFDPDSTGVAVLAWTYQLMQVLHVRTAPSFIRRELLFSEGDCHDEFLISESERLLEGYGFLSEAQITSDDDGAGGRRVTVQTWDEWSTQVDLGVTYEGGLNLETLEVTEENFLGQGIYAEFTHRQRRELRAQSLAVRTPRFFGRSDASIEFGRDRPGSFFNQYVRYPFIGETGRYSLREGYRRGTNFFSYATEGQEAFSQVVVPSFREEAELSAAYRFGEPGRGIITGLSLTRDVIRFPRGAEVVYEDDFDDIQDFPGTPPARIAEQLRETAATRVLAHVGTRRYRYERYEGIDALRERLLVGLGFYVGLSLGKGFSVLAPDGVEAVDDLFGRAHVTWTAPIGSSIVQVGGTVESRREDGAFRDILADTDLVAYLRNDGLQAHTLFVRASLGGGWQTTLPYQVSLGGRLGVRSLAEDRFPGGRSALFTIEDRVVFPWPQRTASLGMTTFMDLGRIWPGDAPYGLDSGWQGALGIGLRIGLPARSRHIWRTDIAFPFGSAGGDPVFRVTFEWNRLSWGFFTPDVSRSRRFRLGAESF